MHPMGSKPATFFQQNINNAILLVQYQQRLDGLRLIIKVATAAASEGWVNGAIWD